MTTGQIVLLAYGAFMVLGGVMGLRAGSKVSLYAGGGSGALLLAAWGLSFVRLDAALWVGAVLAGLLSAVMARRLAASRKFMPAGMLLAASLIALTLLLREVLA